MRKVLVVGATSAIAEASARLFAHAGDSIFLVGRDATALLHIADDLKVRGASQACFGVLDVNDLERHAALISDVEDSMGGLDTVLIAHGTLPDQAECAKSFETALGEFKTNLLSTLSLLTIIANRFEGQRKGTIAVITSVAGDRGRQSNYVYGAAKGAVSIFLQGLRHRLAGAGVKVIDIKPGFVDTPMTANFRKGALWAKPEQVATDIYAAISRGRSVLYTPWFWRWIMLAVRNTPTAIFHRTRL